MRSMTRGHHRDQSAEWGIGLSKVLLRPSSTEDAGTFSLESAESVAAGVDLDPFDVDDALAALVEQSLIDHDGGRYRLLETTRAFARDRLDEAGEAVTFEAAHVGWVRGFVRETRIGLRGPDEARFVEALDTDWANVRAALLRALEWTDPDPSSEIVVHLFMEAAFRRSEILEWIDLAYARNGHVDHAHRHELIGAAGWTAWARGDAHAALDLGRIAVALDPAPGTAIDRLPQWAMGAGLAFTGRTGEAYELFARVLRTVEDDPFLNVLWGYLYTLALINAGRDAEENDIRTELAAIALGNPSGRSYAAWARALAAAPSNPADAARFLSASAGWAASVQAVAFQQMALSGLVQLKARMDVPAEEILAMGLPLARSLARFGLMGFAWPTLAQIAKALHRLGRNEAAALCLHVFASRQFIASNPPDTEPPAESIRLALGDDEMERLAEQAATLSFIDAIRIAETG